MQPGLFLEHLDELASLSPPGDGARGSDDVKVQVAIKQNPDVGLFCVRGTSGVRRPPGGIWAVGPPR